MAKSFTDFLEEYGIETKRHGEHHHTTRDRVQFDCPFCSPGARAFRMSYHLQRGTCNCWTCGPFWAPGVLSAATGLPVRQILQELALPRSRSDPERSDGISKGKLILPKHIAPLKDVHRRYLRNRGFDPDLISGLWGVRGIAVAPPYSWRLFIPIFNAGGKTVSWTTRSIQDDGPLRYWSAAPEQEIVPHKSLLYGEQEVPGHAIIICEGPIDVWRIGPGAVATFGTGYSAEQVERMLKYPVRVICFDNNPEAQRAADKLEEILIAAPGDTYNIKLDSDDPGSATDEEIDYIRKTFGS